MTAPFDIVLLSRAHDRKRFDCGEAALDLYLREQVGQDVRRHVAARYVACRPDEKLIAGYYTLAAGDVALDGLPQEMARRLPRYPSVPVARIGRLAIDRAFQGQGLGAALIWDAAIRALRSEIAVHALAVEAKNETAASFYAHFGVIRFADAPRTMILGLATVRGALGQPQNSPS